ncbi:MAG: complex I NDUFA9 subunit family protein [Thermomicrobiales bacterium]
MSKHIQRILIAGGTGFVGEALRRRLREDGHAIRLLVRSPDDAERYLAAGYETTFGNVRDAQSLFASLTDVDAIINLVAIVRESGEATFEEINFRGTANLVDAACQAGISRFIQMSAIGAANIPDFPYHHTKWRAETYVRDRIADWTIIRPSIIFGPSPEHHFQFIAQLADLLRQGPLVPIPGDGGARFQPIHTDDVAGVFAGVLDDPSAYGQTLEIAGPETLTYREMMDEVARTLEISKPFVNVPIPLVRLGARILTYMPLVESPVTPGQLDMLQIDNTTDVNAAESILNRPLAPFRGGLDFLRNLDEVS